jgi:hypothetical protein
MVNSRDSDWMSIAAQASVEMDSTKLVVLVEQLCSALDDRKRGALPLTDRTVLEATPLRAPTD